MSLLYTSQRRQHNVYQLPTRRQRQSSEWLRRLSSVSNKTLAVVNRATFYIVSQSEFVNSESFTPSNHNHNNNTSKSCANLREICEISSSVRNTVLNQQKNTIFNHTYVFTGTVLMASTAKIPYKDYYLIEQ